MLVVSNRCNRSRKLVSITPRSLLRRTKCSHLTTYGRQSELHAIAYLSKGWFLRGMPKALGLLSAKVGSGDSESLVIASDGFESSISRPESVCRLQADDDKKRLTDTCPSAPSIKSPDGMNRTSTTSGCELRSRRLASFTASEGSGACQTTREQQHAGRFRNRVLTTRSNHDGELLSGENVLILIVVSAQN